MRKVGLIMENFKPKSLEELDSAFMESVRELSSGAQETEEAEPAKPAPRPESQRESLLPKPVFYKAAPMQADLPVKEKPQPAYSEEFRINVPSYTPQRPETQQEEYDILPAYRAGKGRVFARVLVSIMLVISVLLSGFFAGMTYLCNNSKREIAGYHLYPVLLTTASPALSRGDLVVVKDISKQDVDRGLIIVYLDERSEEYRCAVVESAVSDAESDLLITASYVDAYSKQQTVQTKWSAVLGEASIYLPYCLNVYNFISAHTLACIAAAVLLCLMWLLLLILLCKKRY